MTYPSVPRMSASVIGRVLRKASNSVMLRVRWRRRLTTGSSRRPCRRAEGPEAGPPAEAGRWASLAERRNKAMPRYLTLVRRRLPVSPYSRGGPAGGGRIGARCGPGGQGRWVSWIFGGGVLRQQVEHCGDRRDDLRRPRTGEKGGHRRVRDHRGLLRARRRSCWAAPDRPCVSMCARGPRRSVLIRSPDHARRRSRDCEA